MGWVKPAPISFKEDIVASLEVIVRMKDLDIVQKMISILKDIAEDERTSLEIREEVKNKVLDLIEKEAK